MNMDLIIDIQDFPLINSHPNYGEENKVDLNAAFK